MRSCLDYAVEASASLLTGKATYLVYSCNPLAFGGYSLVSWVMHPNPYVMRHVQRHTQKFTAELLAKPGSLGPD